MAGDAIRANLNGAYRRMRQPHAVAEGTPGGVRDYDPYWEFMLDLIKRIPEGAAAVTGTSRAIRTYQITLLDGGGA